VIKNKQSLGGGLVIYVDDSPEFVKCITIEDEGGVVSLWFDRPAIANLIRYLEKHCTTDGVIL
jgi:hypothetical protein